MCVCVCVCVCAFSLSFWLFPSTATTAAVVAAVAAVVVETWTGIIFPTRRWRHLSAISVPIQFYRPISSTLGEMAGGVAGGGRGGPGVAGGGLAP